MVKTLKNDKIFDFIKQLTDAVTHRVSDKKLQKIMQISLIENILNETGYENRATLELLANKYEDFSSPQTLNNLANLGNFSMNLFTINNANITTRTNWKKKLWDNYFNSRIPISNKIHKTIIQVIYKIMFKIKPNHRWNNR
jgi:hypothetical protein